MRTNKEKQFENILKMEKDELEKKLIETYEKQKLSPIRTIIARVIDILTYITIVILLINNGCEIIRVIVFMGIFCILAFYRLVASSEIDSKIYNNLYCVVEGIENYKKFKNGELQLNLDEKFIQKTEKGIKKYLPSLLKNSKCLKICAFIPGIGIFFDEISIKYSTKGLSGSILIGILEGNILINGLLHFTDYNIKKYIVRK